MWVRTLIPFELWYLRLSDKHDGERGTGWLAMGETIVGKHWCYDLDFSTCVKLTGYVCGQLTLLKYEINVKIEETNMATGTSQWIF